MTIKQLYDKIKVLSTPACYIQQSRCGTQDRLDVPSSADPQEITDHAHTCYSLPLPPHRSSRPGMGKRRAKASTSALTEAIFFLMPSSSLSLALNSRRVGPACCCTSWASLMPATHQVHNTSSTQHSKYTIQQVHNTSSTQHSKYTTQQEHNTASTQHSKYTTQQVHNTASTQHIKYTTQQVHNTASTQHSKYTTQQVHNTSSTQHSKYTTQQEHNTASTQHSKYTTQQVHNTSSTQHSKYTTQQVHNTSSTQHS